MASDKPIRIALVDDHEKFREVMKVLLKGSDKYELVGEFENGKEFVTGYNGNADVVLMDIKMPVMNGIIATKKALELYPDIKIIGLSLHSDAEYEKQMKQMGAKGFVSKFTIEENLDNEINKVFSS